MRIPWYGAILALGLWLVVATGCSDSSSAGSGGATTTAATPAAQTQTQPAVDDEDKDEGPPEDAIAIEVGSVQRGSLSALYSTSATLRADKRATVTARTQGVIRKLLVEEPGARLRRGDLTIEVHGLARLSLGWRLFAGFSHAIQIGVTEQGIVIEHHFAVQRQQVSLSCDHQRVDLCK